MKKNRLWLDIALIFAIAVLLRLIYVNQLGHSYFFAPFKGGYDDYIYDNWARQILKGNWFGDGVIYIYRMPLYVYFLSFLYYLVGYSYFFVYIAQAVLGASACVFVYLIGKKMFNRTAGLIGGILAALYGPFLYYTGMLVGETLCLFTICLAVLFLAMFQDAPKRRFLFLAGIFMGFSSLLRGNALVIAPFLLIWLALLKKRALSSLFIFLLGMVLALAPITIRNYLKEKDFVPINASIGLNFYIGNGYGADGRYRVVDNISNNPEDMLKSSIEIADKNSGRALKPSAVSRYWLDRALKSIKDNGVLFLIPLSAKKLLLFWNSYELPDIWDYYFFKRYVPILGFPLLSFSIIASLAIAGMYLSWPRRKKASLLYIFIFGYMISLMLVFVNSRYRTQVVPFLCVFAGYALSGIKTLFEDKARLAKAAIIFGVFLVFSNIGIERLSFATSHNSLGILLKRDGKTEAAIKEYNKAIETAPAYPSPYYNLGILYRDRGQAGLAAQYFKKAEELKNTIKEE